MKVIDLLVKVAKGEEVPKKIKFHNNECMWANNTYSSLNQFKTDDEGEEYASYLFTDYNIVSNVLNEEVEIMEEDTTKEIKKMVLSNYEETFDQFELDVISSINKIIDKINDLEK